MDKFLDFLANNYQTFGIISIIILFALIGIIESSKKKKEKDESVGDNNGQPIKVDENQAEVKNEKVPPVVATNKVEVPTPEETPESIFEPSLDQFASKAASEGGQQLSPEQINGINVPTTLVIEDQSKVSDGSVTDAPTLVIEDKQVGEEVPANNQPAVPEPQMTPTNETPTLVIEDKPVAQAVTPQVPQMQETVTPVNTPVAPQVPQMQPQTQQTNINNTNNI